MNERLREKNSRKEETNVKSVRHYIHYLPYFCSIKDMESLKNLLVCVWRLATIPIALLSMLCGTHTCNYVHVKREGMRLGTYTYLRLLQQ